MPLSHEHVGPKILGKIKNSFTLGTFKLFLRKKYSSFYVSSYRGRVTSKKIKTDELGINAPSL